MSKKLFAVIATIVFTLSFFLVFAQKQIATIPLQGKVFGFAQCSFSGDTTFVAYMEHVDQTVFYRTRLVFRDGTYKVIRDPRLSEKVFVGIDNAQDSLYIYFLDVRRKSVSISYVANGDSLKSSRIAYTLPKEEILIGSFTDPAKKGFQVITASTVDQTMTVVRMHGRDAIQERKIHLPIPFFGEKQNSLAFIPQDHTPSPNEAAARVKVYWNTNRIILTEDILGNYVNKTSGKTTMVSIDPATGEHKIRLYIEPKPVAFGTYVHDNVLYKIQKDRKKFTVEALDSSNKLLHSFQIDKKSVYLNEKAYLRNERSGRVSETGTVKKVLSQSGVPFMSVHPGKENTLLFRVGTHHPLGNAAVVPVFLAFGLVGVAVLTGLSNEYYNREYEDQYFYLAGNKTEINYAASTNFVQERIDIFERNNKGNEFTFKSYGQYQNAVIGIYTINKVPELRIVRFDK